MWGKGKRFILIIVIIIIVIVIIIIPNISGCIILYNHQPPGVRRCQFDI